MISPYFSMQKREPRQGGEPRRGSLLVGRDGPEALLHYYSPNNMGEAWLC
jgi:hypothetical protein